MLAKLSMAFVHSKVEKSSLFGERGMRALQLKMYLEGGGGRGGGQYELNTPTCAWIVDLMSYLFPSSLSVTTTSSTRQNTSPFTFFPSLGVCPRQMPAMSPKFLDENSNLSTFPLRREENKHFRARLPKLAGIL